MISLPDVLILVGFGELSALVLVIGGAILHMRYIDKRLMQKSQPKPTQTNGAKP